MPEFSGIIKGKVETEAFCSVCKKTLQLSNMGIEALKSHIKQGSKHAKNILLRQNCTDIRLFQTDSNKDSFSSSATAVIVESNKQASVNGIGNHDSNQSIAQALKNSSVQAVSKENSSIKPISSCNHIEKYCAKDDVTRAEILWCLQSVDFHISVSATGKPTALFPLMFPDSIIAQSMQLARTKVSYGLTFGLAPYFKEQVLHAVRESNYFVTFFYESLNKMAQTQQMDIAIRFWDKTTQQVETHYFSSAFIGHGRAKDLNDAFQEELKELKLTDMLQVSMDGPNVNWSFLKELECDLQNKHGPNTSIFLNMGSCGLHTVNISYKTAVQSVNWEIISFLRSAYNLMKDVPARRSDYLRFNKSENPQFPKKFCSVRWLENIEVTQTAIKIIPNLQKFVDGVAKEKNKIKSKSFANIKNGLQDKLLAGKLAFFGYLSEQVTPFLKEYQCDAPMIPFLYTDLTAVIRDLMAHVVKEEVINKARTVCDIVLKVQSNLIEHSKFKLKSHAVQAELRKANVTTKEVNEFKSDCRIIIINMCQLLVQKSPVNYKVCKAVSFCDPALIANHANISKSRLTTTLKVFSDKNWVSSQMCDKIEKEFDILTSKKEFKVLCKNYKRSDQRVDNFWREFFILQDQKSFNNLYDFIKKVLILSHGQAFVERGFSINKEIIVENQLNRSLVAQRQIYDAIKSAGPNGLYDLKIDKKMILCFRSARSRYEGVLKEQNSNKDKEALKITNKRKKLKQIEELKAKKRKIINEKTSDLIAVDDEIRKLCMSLGQ